MASAERGKSFLRFRIETRKLLIYERAREGELLRLGPMF